MTNTTAHYPVLTDPADIMRVPCGRTFRTSPDGVPLTVFHRAFPIGADEDRVVLDLVAANMVLLTEDGHKANTTIWHDENRDGPIASDGHGRLEVRVERWDAEWGLTFRGAVDAKSRRLVTVHHFR